MQSQVATAVIYALNNLYLNQQSRWFILNTISNVTLWTGCTDRRFSVDFGELCLCDTLNYLFSSFLFPLQSLFCNTSSVQCRSFASQILFSGVSCPMSWRLLVTREQNKAALGRWRCCGDDFLTSFYFRLAFKLIDNQAISERASHCRSSLTDWKLCRLIVLLNKFHLC